MNLQIGIVGLPNVGKSTLFNALTKKSVPAENFPFNTIDPSVGVVAVPDHRLEKVSKISQSAKVIPATVEFVDIAGLVKGANEGEGLGNQFLSHIREATAIAHVVRIFEDRNIPHVHDEIDPLEDIGVINLELILSDQQSLSRHRIKVERDATRGDKEAQKELGLIDKVLQTLEQGQVARSTSLTKEEWEKMGHWNLLTAKPMLYVLNKQAGGHNLDEMKEERWEKLMRFFEASNCQWVVVDAGVEAELKDLSEEDKQSFRQELGAVDDGVNDCIKAGYTLLDLITFFTANQNEAQARIVGRGTSALQAAATVHTDFRDKFIRGEVILWDKLVKAGSYTVARECGWVRTEGREYVVQDGDVIEFRI